MQHTLAYALTNATQYFTNHKDLFYGSCLIAVSGIFLAVIHEGLKKQYERERPFDESEFYK